MPCFLEVKKKKKSFDKGKFSQIKTELPTQEINCITSKHQVSQKRDKIRKNKRNLIT